MNPTPNGRSPHHRLHKRLIVISAGLALTLMTLLAAIAAYYFLVSLLLPPVVETAAASPPIDPPPVEESAAVESSAVTAATPLPTPTPPAANEMRAADAASLPLPAATLPADEAAAENSAPEKPPAAFGKLLIPAINVDETVTAVPILDAAWDISELGDQIGHLEATGTYPGDALAMTFTGHVTLPWPQISGPFADLVFLERGEEIVYRWQGNDYVYQVERIFRAHPDAVDLLIVPDGAKLVLVTCSGWDFIDRTYAERLVTHATLVRIEPSPPKLEQ